MAEPFRKARPLLIAVAVGAAVAIGVLVIREAARVPSGDADPRYRYSLEKLVAIPSELPRYNRSADILLPLDSPRGVAAGADGRLVVCGDRFLLVLDPRGTVLERYDLEEAPVCVSAGPDGRVYVGFQDHVEVIDTRDGSQRYWPDLGDQAVVTSIAVHEAGIYVADAGNRMVLRFDRDGRLQGSINDDFLVPSPYFDLAAAADGSLWVVNPGRHRLQHYDREGNLIGSWGRNSLDIDGFGGCCNPTHIALLPDGSFATSEKGIPRVKVYSPDGQLTAVVAVPKDFGEYEAGLDLAVTAEGTIVLLVPGERTLRLYRPKAAAGGS